jgi:tetratricopeptide (TPR) repeat protein
LEPNAIDVVAALVRMDVSRDHVPQAFARANAAVTAQPRNALAHNMLGELYLATKNYPKAIEELALSTRLAPNLWLPYRNLALAQMETGDLKAATATYEAAVATVGLVPTLVIDLAAVYERQGRFDDAIKSYRSLHDRSPRLDVAANNLAMLLVTHRNDRVSLDEAQALTASFDHSEDASLLDTQGWVRFKSGDLAEALPELEAAAVHSPKSKIIRYHLGMAQLEAKQFAKARTNLQAALEGGQSFSGAEEARTALAKLGS